MIAFGIAISNREIYETVALPGIRKAAEPDSVILTREGYDSIQHPYNEMMDEAATLPGLEALILMHQDLELTDESLSRRIRSPLRDRTVGIVGALGWRDSPPTPSFHSGGSAQSGLRTQQLSAKPIEGRFGQGYSDGPEEVELIDGILMGLTPWVIRSIRFDQRLARRFHGYDLDFSLRVRAGGGRLVCDPIPHIHHMSRPWRDREEFLQAVVGFARRWDSDARPPEWAPSFSR